MAYVSVILPTYNRPDFLKRALTSVLEQTFINYEVIVVNDAGVDVSGVIDEFNDPRIRLINHSVNKSAPASRNTGIRAAIGKYIAYLDDDDIYYPNHLQTLLDAAHSYRKDFVYSECLNIVEDSHGEILQINERLFPPYHPSLLKRCNFIPVMCIFSKKDLVEQVGLFDETLSFAEDWDLWYRMSKEVDFFHIKNVTCEYRMRDEASHRNAFQWTAINNEKIEKLRKEKYNIITDLRKCYGNDLPNDVIIRLKNFLKDRKIYLYGAGSFFHKIYPAVKNNLIGVFDVNSQKLGPEIKKKYGIEVMPPEDISNVGHNLILSTAVGKIKDVLITLDKYTHDFKNILFLDDFFDADEILLN